MKKGLFEEMRDELILNDYPHVQFIHIQKRSFQNISSLTISNLPELKFLIFEKNSFYSTTSVTLSSIFMVKKLSLDYIRIIFNIMRV